MDVVGGVLLWLAVGAAASALLAAALGRARPSGALLGMAAGAAVGAVAALAWALATEDFSLVYVADHTQRSADVPFRLAGLWGGLAGSLLLWAALLSIVGGLGARGLARLEPDAIRLRCASHAVLAALVTAALGITAVLGRPFARLDVPALDGGGLVPILEHSAMLYHPPVVYLGLALLLVPFAIVTAARLTGQRPAGIDALVRRVALASWVLLAVGMAAGGNWAYVELGWGGYWAWDPVENTALLPWLALTLQLHLRRPVRHPRSTLATDGPVLLAFVLAVAGGWLTRSGTAPSVHAFAQTEDVGRALLVLTAATVALAVGALLVGARRGSPGAEPEAGPPDGRSRALTAQAVLVGLVIVVVGAGTLAPVITSWQSGAASAVDGSYFARATAPIAVALLVLLGVGPRIGEPTLMDRLLWPAVAGLATVALFLWMGWRAPITLALAGTAVFAGASSIDAMVRRRNDRDGAHGRDERDEGSTKRVAVSACVAHAGFALLVLGFAGSSAGHDQIALVAAGRTVTVDGIVVRNLGATTEPGPPPRVVVPVEIEASGRVQREEPSIVGYPARGQLLSENALWSTPGQDVQVAVRRADDEGAALLEIHVRPLAWCVWWGAVVMAGGGALALAGAVRRRPREPGAPAQRAAGPGRRARDRVSR